MTYRYEDRRTKQRGALISVSIEKWEDADTAVVDYSWDFASLASYFVTMRLRRIHGNWVIVDKLWEMFS